jgi:hypothetical protein
MNKRKHAPIKQGFLTNEDQSSAYLFVGKFMGDFANLESALDFFILAYFSVDISLNNQRLSEIYEKNKSIRNVLEFAILGTSNASIQMKIEFVRVIIQEQTPALYARYGGKLIGLMRLLQSLRNTIAHHKTYIHNGQMIISKPKFSFFEKRGGTQKGGVIPEPVGEYETLYLSSVISEEIKERISVQISFVIAAVGAYSRAYNYSLQITVSKVYEENVFQMKDVYTGGVYDISILS